MRKNKCKIIGCAIPIEFFSLKPEHLNATCEHHKDFRTCKRLPRKLKKKYGISYKDFFRYRRAEQKKIRKHERLSYRIQQRNVSNNKR